MRAAEEVERNPASTKMVRRRNCPKDCRGRVLTLKEVRYLFLEIGNVSHALSRLDADQKGIVSNDTFSGIQEMLIVSESGLYALIWDWIKNQSSESLINRLILPQASHASANNHVHKRVHGM